MFLHSHKNILAVITGKYIKYEQRNMEFILVIYSHFMFGKVLVDFKDSDIIQKMILLCTKYPCTYIFCFVLECKENKWPGTIKINKQQVNIGLLSKQFSTGTKVSPRRSCVLLFPFCSVGTFLHFVAQWLVYWAFHAKVVQL